MKESKKVTIKFRGDDIECLDKILELIPTEKKDLVSYINHLKERFSTEESIKNKEAIIDSTGGDIERFYKILDYVPYEQEGLTSFICYFISQFLDQLGLDRRPYDILLWTDEEVQEYLKTGINPYKQH